MKRSLKLLSVASLLVLVAVASAFSHPRADGPQDFTLVNRIGTTIEEVYVSPSTEADWEDYVLGTDVLINGDSVEIIFEDRKKQKEWDLKVVTAAGKSWIWEELDLMTISEVTISLRNGKPYATTK
jgi:hypothetical protein